MSHTEINDIIARLAESASGGYQLDELTADELDELDNASFDLYDAATKGLTTDYEPTYIGKLIYETRDAVKHERNHRKHERDSAVAEQVGRITHITAAAGHLKKAAEEMEAAERIEAKPHIIPATAVDMLTTESAKGMDESSLASIISSSTYAANIAGGQLDQMDGAATILEKHGGARGKRLAKVLRDRANDFRVTLEAHRGNADVARAELDARAERSRKMQEAKQSLPTTTATVDDLLARVAELEEKLASK